MHRVNKNAIYYTVCSTNDNKCMLFLRHLQHISLFYGTTNCNNYVHVCIDVFYLCTPHARGVQGARISIDADSRSVHQQLNEHRRPCRSTNSRQGSVGDYVGQRWTWVELTHGLGWVGFSYENWRFLFTCYW